MNNCIGLKNHTYFYVYLLTQSAYLIVTLLLSFHNINSLMSTENFKTAFASIFPILIHTDLDHAQMAYDFTIVVSIVLTLAFMPFVFLMTAIHTFKFYDIWFKKAKNDGDIESQDGESD